MGGGERYSMYLAKGLAERPEISEVKIVSFANAVETAQISDKVVLDLVPPDNGKLGHQALGMRILEKLRNSDIVHIQQCFSPISELLTSLAIFFGKKVFLTDHGARISRLGANAGLCALADGVISVSQFADSYFSRFETRARYVAPGGVPTEQFQPNFSPFGRDRLVFVGRILPHKGIDRVIRAIDRNVRFQVFGSVGNEKYFSDLKELSKGKSVEFILSADDAVVHNAVKKAFALILPSTYVDCYGGRHEAPELMGFTLLEAMAMATPVICSNVGGMPEFVDHGAAGFVFDTEDELKDAIRSLHGKPNIIQEFGRNGHRRVNAEFSSKRVSSNVASVYGV